MLDYSKRVAAANLVRNKEAPSKVRQKVRMEVSKLIYNSALLEHWCL